MSHTPKTGHILEDVIYIYNNKLETIVTKWLDFDANITEEMKVIPAFPANPKSKSNLETGRCWANNNKYIWDNTQNNYIEQALEIIEETRKNNPISNIKIVTLEKRSVGGRAYKVLVDDKFYFDLREDVLLDTMLNCGVSKGGQLNGQFVWAIVGSQMKLIRVGSKLYDNLSTKTKEITLKKIPNDELEVGGIYQNKAGDTKVFCGFVDTLRYTYVDKRNYYNREKSVASCTKRSIINGSLWLEVYVSRYVKNDDDRIAAFTQVLSNIDGTGYNVSVTKEHSFIKKFGKIELDKDIINTLKEYKKQKCVASLATYKKSMQNDLYNSAERCWYNERHMRDSLAYYSDVYHMVKHGEKVTSDSTYDMLKDLAENVKQE